MKSVRADLAAYLGHTTGEPPAGDQCNGWFEHRFLRLKRVGDEVYPPITIRLDDNMVALPGAESAASPTPQP